MQTTLQNTPTKLKLKMDPDSIVTAAEFAKKVIEMVIRFLSEEGTVEAYGRTIHFETRPKSHGFPPKLRYYCKVRDVASGINARADNYKSKRGAQEHAVKHLADQLAAAGIIRR